MCSGPRLHHSDPCVCVPVHAYMQTFGALTQPLSLESISRHSINFYEAQWQQHQMELCQPLYPRSNTISVFSDISSDSSFSSGSPERFSAMAPALPVKTRRVSAVRVGVWFFSCSILVFSCGLFVSIVYWRGCVYSVLEEMCL